MSKYDNPLIEYIKKIFGKDSLIKGIGTRTNIKRLTGGIDSPYSGIYDAEKLKKNPKALERAKKLLEDEIPYIATLNDKEKNMLLQNLKVVDSVINPQEAEIIDFAKGAVPKAGIDTLKDKFGIPEGIDRQSEMGQLINDINVSKAKVDEFRQSQEGVDKSLQGILEAMNPFSKSQVKIRNEGMMRTGAREYLTEALKKGELKNLRPDMENTIKTFSGSGYDGDVLEVFRHVYGEDAYNQLAELAPNYMDMTSYDDIKKYVRSNMKLKQMDKPGNYVSSYIRDELELGNPEITKQVPMEDDTIEQIYEYYSKGFSPMETMYTANKILKGEKYGAYSIADREKLVERLGDHIFQREVPIDESIPNPDELAGGGRPGQGLDYLLGM